MLYSNQNNSITDAVIKMGIANITLNKITKHKRENQYDFIYAKNRIIYIYTHTHTMGYYSAIKWYDILTYAATWMNPENILSAINQI